MAKQIKKSFTGGLDRDTSERLMAQGDYRHALNVRNISSESNQVGVIENVKGNKIPDTNYIFPNLSQSASQELWFAPGLGINDTVTLWIVFSDTIYEDTADLAHTDANGNNIPDTYYTAGGAPYAETNNGEKMYPVTGNGSTRWGRAKMWVDFVNNYKADLLTNMSIELTFWENSVAVQENVVTYNAATDLWEIEDFDANNSIHTFSWGGNGYGGSNYPIVKFKRDNVEGEVGFFYAYLAPGTFAPVPLGTPGTNTTVSTAQLSNNYQSPDIAINNYDYDVSAGGGEFSLFLQKAGTYNVPDYGDDYDVLVNYNCIGAYEDTQQDKIYYFVASKVANTNENAYLAHILEYDLQTDAVSVVFRDTANEQSYFFDWEFEHKITNINKMGDVLYWTHELYGNAKKLNEESKDKGKVWGGGEPCSINVKKAKATLEIFDGNGVSYFPQSKYYPAWFYAPLAPFLDPHPNDLISARERKLEFVQVIKRMPKYKPIYRFDTDETRDKNNVFGFSWQFKYRYHYWDGEVSSWSPISDVNASLNLMTNSNIQDPAIISTSNKINIFVRNASQMVEFIEVAARKCKDLGEIPFGNRGEFFSIAKVKNNAANWQTTYSISDGAWTDAVLYTKIEFYNDKIYTYTDPIEGMNLFDKVPRRAKTQTVIGDNRLAYANYIDGFNLPDNPIIKVSPRYHENSQLEESTIINNEIILYPFWTDLRDSRSKEGAYSFNKDRNGNGNSDIAGDDSSGWSKDLSPEGTKRWVNGTGYDGGNDYYPSFDDDAYLDYFSGPSSIDSNGNQVYWSPAQYAGQGIPNPILTGGLEYSGGNSNTISDWAVNDDSDWDNGYNLATVSFSGKFGYNNFESGNYCGIHSNNPNEGEGAVVVEDDGNWKHAKDWDTSAIDGQYGAGQTGQFYIWNPLARLYTDGYGQPNQDRHRNSGYFCGTSGGGLNGYAKIRFNFNYESLEQEFEPGASIVLTMNFKSGVWLEDNGTDYDDGGSMRANRDAYRAHKLGDFNKTWIIRCPESLDSIDEQMKYVTHVLSDWGDQAGGGTDNDSVASEAQAVYLDATGNSGVGLPFWNQFSDDAKKNSAYATKWTWTNRPMALVYQKILTMELSADAVNEFGDGDLGQNIGSSDAGTRLTTNERGVSLAFNVDPEIIENMGEPSDGWAIAQKEATKIQATNQVTLEYKKNTALLLEGLADNVSQTFKTGAYHDFGLIYYDLEGRCSTVAIDANNSTYVKFAPEDKTPEEIVENGGIGNGPVSMEWEINHRAPTWARFFRWAYGRNSSVDDFIQFLGRKPFCAPNSSEDKRIYLSFNSFRGNEESYVEVDDPLIQYQFVKGDRIRFLYKREGAGYAVFNSYIDLKLSGMNYYDVNMTADECPFVADLDPNGDDDGFYLEFHEVSTGVEAAVMSKAAVLGNVHIYDDVIFEVYRPKKSVDPDKTIYYEYGPLYRIIPNLHLHTGDIQNQGIANLIDNNGNYYSATGAKGKFTLGDVWYKPRIMKGADDGTTIVNFVEDYFLNDFYETNHFSIGRINVYSPYAKERHHIAGVTWSEVYNPEMSYNGLSTFLPATVNYKTYEITDGAIQKIVGRDTDMIMIHEDRTHKVAVNKDIMVNASGQGNMGLSNNVLGNAIPFPNYFGISKNPESCVKEGNVLYWMDVKRGAVVKLTNGIKVISEMKMTDYFRDKSVLYNPYNPEYGFYDADLEIGEREDNKNFRLLGGYNPKHLEFMIQHPRIRVLAGSYGQISTLWENSTNTWNADLSGGNTTTIEAETVAWTDRANRWTAFYSHNDADYYGKINRTFVSWKNGQIYVHDSDVSNYCSFYPTVDGDLTIYNTELEFPFTQGPSSVKTFKSISIEGNQAKTCTTAGVNESDNSAYDVTLTTELIDTQIDRRSFDEKERIQYAQVPFGSPTTESGLISSGSEWIGLGQCAIATTNVTGTNTTFVSMNLITAGTTPDPVYIFINDVAYQLCTSAGTLITVSSVTTQTALVLSGNPVSGDFLMYLNNGTVVTSTQAANNVKLFVKRSGIAEGDTVKGTFAKAHLSKKTKEKVEIIAVNSIISKSELSDR